MGQVLNPLMLGLDRTQELYRASTLCGACKSVCPVGIDHPSLFLYYRAKDVLGDPNFKSKDRPWAERQFFKMWSWAASRPWLWNWGVRMVRPYFNKDANDGVISKGQGPFEGWFRNRDMPAMAWRTFHERWKEKLRSKG
jgi:L-lactate dehydrogenase complex protein LldF